MRIPPPRTPVRERRRPVLETNVMFRKLAIGNEKLYALSDRDIQDIHTILLDMIADLDALCRKHGLTYYLVGGTGLGAVRHQGFIPWDEDVDIGMPRADYDRVEKLLLEEYGDKYWVQCVTSSDRYDLNFMKFRKKGTRYVELFESEPERAGIFVDIWPMENVPDFPLWRWLHGTVSDFLYLCCSCVRVHTKKQRFLEYLGDNKQAVRLIKVKAFLGACLSFFSLNTWCRITDRWCAQCKNSRSKYISYPSGRKHYFGELCTRASFEPAQEVPFEGHRFFTMSYPAEYLTGLYGDYMQVPPEDQRERHSILELDLGQPEQ